MIETAYFATGCFWGAERRFWQLAGVMKTAVGYMGGSALSPTYEAVCTGATGHAEMVQVEYNTENVSYRRLLEEFWTMHDPTSLNRQGGDVGSQYRSAIFYTNDNQREAVESSRALYGTALSAAGHGSIVTEVRTADGLTFWPAEEYHQRYLEKNPKGYDCHSQTGVPFPSHEWPENVVGGAHPTGDVFPVAIDEAALRARVDPLSYEVLRNAATEQPFTGEYVDTETVGSYRCKACSAELFRSETKFHSGCGWPSFYAPSANDAVVLIEDRSLAPRVRTEVRCAACGSHLGHVFEGEGYDVPTDQRWCINSVALVLEPK
jgi:methionine-S-sulfoxide reductase/methionine-R-sulfoxide reductase